MAVREQKLPVVTPQPRPALGSAPLGAQWTGKETRALPSGPASPHGALRGPPAWRVYCHGEGVSGAWRR